MLRARPIARLAAVLAAVVVAVALVVALGGVVAERDAPEPRAARAPGEPVATPTGDDAALLRAGNLVLRVPRRELTAARRLATAVSGGSAPALRAAGQAVVVRASGGDAVTARAWRRSLRAESVEDPALRAFLEHWLGRGASA